MDGSDRYLDSVSALSIQEYSVSELAQCGRSHLLFLYQPNGLCCLLHSRQGREN